MSNAPYPDRQPCANCLRHGERIMRPPNLSPCVVCVAREDAEADAAAQALLDGASVTGALKAAKAAGRAYSTKERG